MKLITRRAALIGSAAVCAAAGIGRKALANGDEFFGAEEIPGKPQFVFFGSIKDTQGNYLDAVAVQADVAVPPLTLVVYSNVLGRYRTADLGQTIMDLGYEELDPKNFSVSVSRPGYNFSKRVNRAPSRQKKGAFEVNFIMEKDPTYKEPE